MDEHAPVEGGGQGFVESPSRAPKSKVWIWGIVVVIVVAVLVLSYYFLADEEVEVSDNGLTLSEDHGGSATEVGAHVFPEEVFTYISPGWEKLGNWEKGEVVEAFTDRVGEYYMIHIPDSQGDIMNDEVVLLNGIAFHMSEEELESSFNQGGLAEQLDDMLGIEAVSSEEGRYKGRYSYTIVYNSLGTGSAAMGLVVRRFYVSKRDLVYSFEYVADKELYDAYLDDAIDMIDSSTAFS